MLREMSQEDLVNLGLADKLRELEENTKKIIHPEKIKTLNETIQINKVIHEGESFEKIKSKFAKKPVVIQKEGILKKNQYSPIFINNDPILHKKKNINVSFERSKKEKGEDLHYDKDEIVPPQRSKSFTMPANSSVMS